MLASSQSVEAMLAGEAAGTWAIEPKIDGVRSLISVRDGAVAIHNRRDVDWTQRWPEIASAFADADLPDVVLDAEIACLRFTGRAATADFAATASRAKLTRGTADAALSQPAHAHLFDVLAWGGRDVRGEPYAIRRELLSGAVSSFSIPGTVILPSHTTGFAAAWATVIKHGGEGVVAKHLASVYRGGPSRAWRKTKVAHTVTAVAVGYEAGGGPYGFGALHLALVTEATVVPAGRVGSGLSELEIAEITAAIDAGDMPVVEIGHNGTTEHGHLRHPVFLGRRVDATWREARADQITP